MASMTLKLSTVKEENCIVTESLLACRICLAADVKLFNIRECGLDQVFVDLMGTTLSAWDGFPQHLCPFCRTLLLRSQELRARCRRAEELLKKSLMHQRFITTKFIRSIDRNYCKLTHAFSHVWSNRDLKCFKHEDSQTDPNSYIIVIEKNIEDDVKDFDTIVNDDEDETHFDLNSGAAYTELKDVATPQNTSKVNIVECNDKTVKKNVKTLQVNIVVESNNKTVKDNVHTPQVNIVESHNSNVKQNVDSSQVNPLEWCNKTKKKDVKKRKLVKNKTEKAQRKEKKGQSWRLKPFCEEEGFKEFEEKYNFKIVSLSEEDMVKEMEKRKESENYIHSLFKCETCFKGFLSSSAFNNHMKAHDPTLAHGCRLCQRRFFSPGKLRVHIRDAHQLKFYCRQCDENINSKASAVRHAAFHAGTTFKCNYCDQQFRKSTSRNSHVRMMHPTENADGGTCSLCGETFISAFGLMAHMTRSHETEPAVPTLRCRACKVRFESAAAIEKHRSAQPGGKCDGQHSSCKQCGEAYASEQDLLAHRVQQHGLHLFTCDMCDKTFESKQSVATHIDRVHRLIRPPVPDRHIYRRRMRLRAAGPAPPHAPVCEHCGKRVSCMATLKIHMNKHTGERPYKCHLCPNAYMTPYALNAHLVSHTGERKWRCPECPATFLHQSSIYQHSRIHRGEKPYECSICSKTFTQSGSLATHVKYVHMKVKPPPRKRSKKAAT